MVSPESIRTAGPKVEGAERVLTPAALTFVEDLARRFRPRIDELLGLRRERQRRVASGARLGFLPDTSSIRSGDWRIAQVPADLLDRRAPDDDREVPVTEAARRKSAAGRNTSPASRRGRIP